MDRPSHPGRRLVAAVGSLVLLLAAALVAGAPPASAQLYGPIPANAAGDPTYDFTDQDSIWAYVRSDLAGGRICIVPEETTVETGTCDGALGGANHLVGIGTLYTLISGHGLPAGNYRLMVENSVEEPTEVGEVFTVTACPDCPPNPDAAAVEAFKAAARAMSGDDGNMTRMCQLTGVLELVGGKAIRARAVVEPPASTGPLTADAPSFVMTLVGGTAFAMWNPAAANIQKGLDIAQALACGAEQMYADQAADPPDPDFGTVAQPVLREFERLGPAELDAVSASLDRQRALGVAMLHGYERFQGAQQAGDADAQVRQLRAAGGFAGQQAQELTTSAAALRAWADVAASDAELGSVMLSAAEKQELVAAYSRVRTDGFTGTELDELRGLGYTDEQIATIRARFTSDIAAVPADTSYADALRQVADGMEQQVQAYTDMGLELLVVAARIEQANTNHPPVADDLSVAASTGRPVTVQLTGSDPDGDPISFDVARQPEHGTLSGSGASRTYTSADGFTGTDTFTYTATDGEATSAPATVTITVEPRTNNAPTATAFSVNARQGEPVEVRLSASDPDGDPLTYDVVPPQHGQLTGTAPDLTYTSDLDFTGTDELRYTVSDGQLSSAQATVWIQVAADVVAANDFLRADPAGVMDVLQNDAATTPLVVSSATDGEHGSVTCGDLGGCTYRAVAGFTGADGFDYTVRDGAGRTSTAHVQVEVVPPPPAGGSGPTARDDRTATVAGRSVDVAVLANDTGTAALALSASTQPSHGLVDCATGGTCRYTPGAGFTGYDGFGYTVTDADGATARASVEVTVAPAGARLDVTVTGRPTSPDGPTDTEVVQGESARWGAAVTASPALSQDEVAALSPPTGDLRPSGPHTPTPGSLTHARGWTAGPVGETVPFAASDAAVLGNRVTRPIPRPLPPISQGTGGDGHVPILVGTKVYAFFHHSSPTSVTCVDRATGLLCPGYPRTVWQMGTTDVNGPGVVVDGRIYTHLVPAGGGGESQPIALFCWDTRSDSTCGLEVLDRTRIPERAVASAPVLEQGRIYLGAQTGRMYCYDPVAGKDCATPSAPTGLTEASGNAMDVVSHGNRVFVSSRDATTSCLTVPAMERCPGWASPKSLGGWNLVNQHDAQGAVIGVCAVGTGTARCVTDAGQESTYDGFPVNDDYYGNTQEGEAGTRTFIPSLSRGGLGCWDWSTSKACTGARFDEGGWVSSDTAGQPLPSAYGTTWDGSCLVALGDPGRVFTMDADGNSPCTSLATGTSSLAMDLRDQRCDGGAGRATWRAVELLETDPAGAELSSVRVRVVDATSGEELLTGDLIGGVGRLSLSSVDPERHPSVRVQAVAVARSADAAWADDVPPRIALTWDADPLQVCVSTSTVVDCAQPDLAAVLVRAALTGSTDADEASLTVRRSPSCTPPPAPTPAPTPTPTPSPTPGPTPPGDPDRDRDGLLNTVETDLGTDPDDPDTDDDRLGDGLEVTGVRIRERFEVCGAKTKRSITVTTNPLRVDTDKDGLADGVEVKGYVIKQRVIISNAGDSYVIGRTRTNPAKADTDRDRLTDKQERTGSANKRYDRHKTDPSKCDTDHGALSDGIEVNHRSDPADFRSGPGDPGTIPMGRRPMLLRGAF